MVHGALSILISPSPSNPVGLFRVNPKSKIMITDTIEPVAAPPEPKRANLILHQGGNAVSRGEIASTPTPRRTATWQPVPHLSFLQTVERALLMCGLSITGQSHGLSHDGARYFGLLEVESYGGSVSRVVGLRNAHDMRFAAGLVAGSQVLVCDNLSFAGEIALARKHTSGILRDLSSLVQNAVLKLNAYWDGHERRIEAYHRHELTDPQVHDLTVRAVDTGVMANSHLPKVLQEWREPRHPDFEPRNVWSLQNAFTEVFKGRVDLLPERTMRLHQLLDQEAGLN